MARGWFPAKKRGLEQGQSQKADNFMQRVIKGKSDWIVSVILPGRKPAKPGTGGKDAEDDLLWALSQPMGFKCGRSSPTVPGDGESDLFDDGESDGVGDGPLLKDGDVGFDV